MFEEKIMTFHLFHLKRPRAFDKLDKFKVKSKSSSQAMQIYKGFIHGLMKIHH